MEIYIKELKCDWYMGSDDFYEEDQITSDLIEKIKDAIVRNEEDGPYNIYAAYDDGDWLCMYFREDLVFIQITWEPDHEYVYYDKKYEGKYDLELIEFDQSEVPRIETCEDMVLAANIFEEWALYGKRYPATWADMHVTPNIFDAYYPQVEPERLYRLSIYGNGKNKSKTIVFLKKYFKDSDYKQTLKRVEQFPIVLCVDFEHDILAIEKELTSLEINSTGALRRTSKDKFFLIMNKKELKKLEVDKFSVLDQIRKIDFGNNLPVTISMGIGIDGDTINENLKLATGALDLALGRGGDQAVVKTKDKFAFYGGKSKAVEKTTKVKSRLIGHALREVILESDHVFIMGHKYPDMDAIGAAIGIYDICKSCNKTANIVLNYANESIEEFIKRIKKSDYYDGVFVDSDYAIRECEKNTVVVVVDTHRPNFTECPQLLDISDKVVVIDHHRRGVDFINDTVLLFHEIYVSSTCEMVTELVQYIEDDVRINKLTAEGLLAGISLDTKNFAFKTGVRTFEAASYLKKSGADTIEVKKLFNSDIKDFITKAEIIKNAKVINHNICLAYTKTESDNINIVIAQAADELLNIKEVEASFVLGRKDDRVFISARSLGNINVHVLMEKLGGGGHRDMAGVQLDTSLEKAYEMVEDTIQTYIKEEE